MEQYRRTVKRRMVLLALLALAAAGLALYSVFSQETADDFLKGFQGGVGSGLSMVGVIYFVKYRKILGDDQALQKKRNQEEDERLRAIRAKAGLPFVQVTSIIMLVAAVAGGYVQPMIFYVLMPAAALQLTAALVVKLVYLKIM